MLPTYHRAYWMGLAAVTRTTWRWLEPSVPPLSTPGAYVNWYAAGERPEPNNMRPPEDCAVSNLTAAVGGVGGWADQNCGVAFPFICMLIRGWLGARLRAAEGQAAGALAGPEAGPPPAAGLVGALGWRPAARSRGGEGGGLCA
jgi:hypothetical protein